MLPDKNANPIRQGKKSLRYLHRIIAMSLEEHHDVFGRTLGRLFYIITMTFFTMIKTGKNTMMSL
jgi:hypothetical protein